MIAIFDFVYEEKKQESINGKAAEACNFIKKESLAQVFSREFCKIFKSPFLIKHLW